MKLICPRPNVFAVNQPSIHLHFFVFSLKMS